MLLNIRAVGVRDVDEQAGTVFLWTQRDRFVFGSEKPCDELLCSVHRNELSRNNRTNRPSCCHLILAPGV